MQFFTGISGNTQSKSYMLSLTWVCLGILKWCIVGYSLTCPIISAICCDYQENITPLEIKLCIIIFFLSGIFQCSSHRMLLHLFTAYQQPHYKRMASRNVWLMRVMEHLLLCPMMKENNMLFSVIALEIWQTTSPVNQTRSSKWIPRFFLWICNRYCYVPYYLMIFF